jgi:uncharacterized SAM-binding protein YcdF (DUF218 family)
VVTSTDRDGLGTFALTVAVTAALAGIPLAVALLWVLWVGLRTCDSATCDLLVVFGKRLRDDNVDDDYRARLETAARLAAGCRRHRILILGGRTGLSPISEAEAGRRLLRSLPGGGALNIVLEQESDDTLSNLRRLRGLLTDAERHSLTLITNRYHLARVGQIAGSLGLGYRCCAAGDRCGSLRPRALPRWLLEAFFVLWFATGKLWATTTGNRRMLARVT